MSKRRLTIEDAEQGARRFTWDGADGTPFPGLEWTQPGTTRANVLCIHGLGGAASDFGPLGRHLAGNGCTVRAVNLRGQGNDPEPERRGHFLDPAGWRDDLEEFADSFPDKAPLVVIGESMGSLVAIDSIAHGALRPERLVLAAPVPELRAPVPGWAVPLVRGGARLFPRLRFGPMRFVNGKTSIPRLTSDDDYMAYLQNIPHRVGGFTLEFLTNFHDLMRETQQCAARIDVPTLMLSAGRDIFIRPEQSRAFFDCIAAPEKEYVFYPQSHHLLWHDVDADDVLERITRWITEGRA
jgi:alpha-beta hydrolase superfamily lysophospholipase